MKFNRVLFLLLLVCTTMFSASAQDMIVKKNGTIIKAKVIKVGSSEVEYKKWTNQNNIHWYHATNDITQRNQNWLP